jgi:hypothetical protein
MHLCVIQHITCSGMDHAEGVRVCGSNVREVAGA